MYLGFILLVKQNKQFHNITWALRSCDGHLLYVVTFTDQRINWILKKVCDRLLVFFIIIQILVLIREIWLHMRTDGDGIVLPCVCVTTI